MVMSPLTLAFVVCLWPVCESAFDLGFLKNVGIYLLRYSAMSLLFLAQPPRIFFMNFNEKKNSLKLFEKKFF